MVKQPRIDYLKLNERQGFVYLCNLKDIDKLHSCYFFRKSKCYHLQKQRQNDQNEYQRID